MGERHRLRLLLSLLGLVLVGACGSPAAQPSSGADPGDAAAPRDGGPGVDATPHDGGGDACPPGTGWADDRCRAASPKGPRDLGLEINPPGGMDYARVLDQARATGVTVVPSTLPWGPLLERSAPTNGKPNIEGLWFKALSDHLVPRGMKLLLSIPVVDTVQIQAPPDLRARIEAGTPLDAPEVIARYEAVIDALLANADPKMDWRYFVVANEADIALHDRPQAAWDALGGFLTSIRAYVKARRPQTQVGVNVSFGAISDGAISARAKGLAAKGDVVFVSYYLGSNGFGTVGADVAKDMDTAVAFAGGLPLVFKELGYATGVTGQSPEGQRAFVRDWFSAWDRNAARVPLVNMSRMFDNSRAACESEAAGYGAPGNEQFIRYLCSLGLHGNDGVEKPAWRTFRDEARLRGF